MCSERQALAEQRRAAARADLQTRILRVIIIMLYSGQRASQGVDNYLFQHARGRQAQGVDQDQKVTSQQEAGISS